MVLKGTRVSDYSLGGRVIAEGPRLRSLAGIEPHTQLRAATAPCKGAPVRTMHVCACELHGTMPRTCASVAVRAGGRCVRWPVFLKGTRVSDHSQPKAQE